MADRFASVSLTTSLRLLHVVAERRLTAHPKALLLDAAILSRMRSPVTSRSNWAKDKSTLRVSRDVTRGGGCRVRPPCRLQSDA